MFGSAKNGVSAYAKIGIETGVAAASPHKLIVMLFEGALVAVSMGLQHMKNGDIPAKGKSISKAILIIDSGLRAALDKSAGGEIAESLDSLYEYMGNRLLMANLKNQPEILEEVHRLLSELKGAWDAIGNTTQTTQPQAAAQAAAQGSTPPTRSSTFVSA
jgi:flagellar protein FliS